MDPLLIRQLTICAVVAAVVGYSMFRFLRKPPKPSKPTAKKEPFQPFQGLGLSDAINCESPPSVIIDPLPPKPKSESGGSQ